MPIRRLFLLSLLLCAPLVRADQATLLWNSAVQPILDDHCVKCHGPLERKSGLELDSVEMALKGNDDGPVIVPGKPDESPLIQALAADADPHMPKKGQLDPADITKLRAWVTALGKKAAVAKETPKELPPMEPPEAIDHFIAEGWQDREVKPAPLCDDRTFVRRIYLDLAGRIPTGDEAQSFLFDGTPKKREALVDRLLAGDEYPRNFREIWNGLLMPRDAGRREQRRSEGGWLTFLENAFKENRPWNEVVRALVVARPEKPEDKGAQWFLFERRNEYQRMAEAVAPIIYGTKIDCAQCHDHPLAREIKQAHYWGLVAAFNRSTNGERGSTVVKESAIGGFMNFTNLKKESQPALLTLLTGKTIPEVRPDGNGKQEDSPENYVDPNASVKVPKFSRRAALADAATQDNPLLARSFVNYTWAILMGRGIVQPVDEMNSKHPASHPELLDWLGKDFSAHGYDPRRLVRSIVLSNAYQLAPWTGDGAPPPEAFASALEKPLIAEALARSVEVATGHTPGDTNLRQVFVEAFPDVLPRVARSTLQQAMFLNNSDRLASELKPESCAVVERVAALPSAEAQVRELFRVALIRQPDADELKESKSYLEARSANPAQAVSQLLWALVTDPEFVTNH